MSKLQVALVVAGFIALAVQQVMIILENLRLRNGLNQLAGVVERQLTGFRADHRHLGVILRDHMADANDIGRRVETLEKLLEPVACRRGDSRPEGVA